MVVVPVRGIDLCWSRVGQMAEDAKIQDGGPRRSQFEFYFMHYFMTGNGGRIGRARVHMRVCGGGVIVGQNPRLSQTNDL